MTLSREVSWWGWRFSEHFLMPLKYVVRDVNLDLLGAEVTGSNLSSRMYVSVFLFCVALCR
jgi:hypothetical protein